MSLTTEGMTPADIAAVTGNRNGNGGFGYGDGSWFLWIILLFAMMNGGWGNNGNNGYGGGYGGWGMYPWLNQSNQFNDGFQNQMLNSSINEIRSAVTALAQQLCSCCGDMQMALANGFAGVEQNANARQMANMNQLFGFQTSTMQGFNGVQGQIAQASADNRLGIADLKYTVATENCADRTQSMMNTRDIIENCNRNNQAVLDKLCQLELDGVKGQLAQAQRENTGLQNQLNMANLAASQAAQTATFQQGMNAEVDALYNRLKNCPVPTQPVYGNQPIFTCNGNQGCGCGCGAFA